MTELRESPQILEGIEFQRSGESSESNVPSLKVVVLLFNVFLGIVQTLVTLIQGCLRVFYDPMKMSGLWLYLLGNFPI